MLRKITETKGRKTEYLISIITEFYKERFLWLNENNFKDTESSKELK